MPRLRHTVTVPACVVCNEGSSKAEEEFRIFISVKDGNDTPESIKFWKEGALRSVRNNKRMHRELLSGAQILLRSPSTGRFEPRQLFTWNLAESHHPIIRKITRGLYYHNFKSPLAPPTKIDVTYLPKLTPEMIDFCYQSMAPGDTGGDPRLVYAYLRNDDYPTKSIWIFQFYKRHWASAFTDFARRRGTRIGSKLETGISHSIRSLTRLAATPLSLPGTSAPWVGGGSRLQGVIR